MAEQEYGVSGTQFGGVGTFAANRMTDLMEYLIIVHDDEQGIYSGSKYFQTKGYGTIKVEVDESNPDNVKMYGGEQLERGTSVVVAGKNIQTNGITYSTLPGEEDTPGYLHSAIPTPPTRSVYDNLRLQAESELGNFYEFYNLCYPGANYATNNDTTGLLKKVFEIKNGNALTDSAMRYSIFYTNTSDTKAYTKNTIPFFNIFHYTVYAPSNEAIREMYELGLPTWQQVDSVATAGSTKKAASMLRSIINFAKYHFQDNSVYVDNKSVEKKFTSAVINEKTNRFYDLKVASEGNTITVTDELGNVRRVVVTGEENRDWNIMCRDNVYTSGGTGPSASLTNYSSSAYTVLQPIDGALLNESMFGYDGRFKRFAKNGAPVEVMYVDGTGSIEVNGEKHYLVASVGNIKIANLEGVQEIHKAGYLMRTIDESDSEYDASLTREKLLVKESQNVLVTDEGLWVNEVKDSKGNVTSYEYAIKEKDGKRYMVRYNNDATVKEEIYVGDVTPEEDGDNN